MIEKPIDQKDLALDERFTSAESKISHFKNHKRDFSQKKHGYLNADEYEARADALARSQVDDKTIFGYEIDPNSYSNKDKEWSSRRFCKYNKETEEYVVYAGFSILTDEPIILSFYKMPFREFETKKAINFLDVIPNPEYSYTWDFRYNQQDSN